MSKQISIKGMSDADLMSAFDDRIQKYYSLNKEKAVPFGICWDLVRLRKEVLNRGIPTVH